MKFLSTLSLRRATMISKTCSKIEEFLSTLSLRRATQSIPRYCNSSEHFYPRSPCGERRLSHPETNGKQKISIHALLAESDFLPHSAISCICSFLSTLSLRRATAAAHMNEDDEPISIHALLAESDIAGKNKIIEKIISIHALLAESDLAVPEPPLNRG